MYRDAGEGLRAQLLLLLMACLGVQATLKEKEMEFSRKVSVACEAACLTKARPPLKLYCKMVYLFLQISIAMKPKGNSWAQGNTQARRETGSPQRRPRCSPAQLPTLLSLPALMSDDPEGRRTGMNVSPQPWAGLANAWAPNLRTDEGHLSLGENFLGAWQLLQQRLSCLTDSNLHQAHTPIPRVQWGLVLGTETCSPQETSGGCLLGSMAQVLMRRLDSIEIIALGPNDPPEAPLTTAVARR